MKKAFKTFLMIALVLAMGISVSAEVFTSSDRTYENAYYVAGHSTFFPIEYYNYTTKSYEGVIPEILKSISLNTGVDFVYVENSGSVRDKSLRDGDVDMLSAYVEGSASTAVEKTIKVFEYEYQDQPISVSFGFGKNSDPKLVELIESEVSKLTEQEISGYFVSTSLKKPDNSLGYAIVITILAIALVLLIALLWMRLMGTKKQMHISIMTDADTGLDNLLCFEHRFENEISEYSRPSYYVAYLVADINYFKAMGTDGNFREIIKYTASVLKSFVKHNEIAARITENGFALCIHSPSENEAKNRIEKLVIKLGAYLDDENDASKVFYTALCRMKSTDRSSEVILFNLRRNCNKLVGSSENVVFCDDELMNSEIAEKRLIDSAQNAIKNKEFKLYLQFIVDNKNQKVVSAEALSRWHQPNGEVLTPARYIEAMEASSLIGEHDFYMFEMICRKLHKWHNTELGGVSISCNFTRITLSESGFIDRIKDITTRYVFDHSKIIIEITEDSIEKSRATIIKNIMACKELGFRVALDDMGSGYTSLVNLCEYPIDIVKIDRDVLIKTSEKSGKDLFIGMIALAHSLGLKVVCEGVETEAQKQLVAESECDYIQGFYYSKVHQEENAEEFLKNYESGVREVNE